MFPVIQGGMTIPQYKELNEPGTYRSRSVEHESQRSKARIYRFFLGLRFNEAAGMQ